MIEGRDFAAASTVGARSRQEDDWGTHVNPPAREDEAGLLAVVADGMGGMPAGDQASGIAIRAFLDSYPAIGLPVRERLRRALAHANREVGIAVEADSTLAGMGCTLVAALFFRDRCEWLSVGDSLILRCRGGKLERINPLHIYASELDDRARRGEITPAAAADDPERAALTSVVQGEVLEEVAQGELELVPGDVVVLASDGIATLSEEEIASICQEKCCEGAGRIAETLIGRIEGWEREGQDNATVIVVREGADTECADDPTDEVVEAQNLAADPQAVADEESGLRDASAATLCRAESVTENATQQWATRPLTKNPLMWIVIAFIVGMLTGVGGLVVFSCRNFPGGLCV